MREPNFLGNTRDTNLGSFWDYFVDKQNMGIKPVLVDVPLNTKLLLGGLTAALLMVAISQAKS